MRREACDFARWAVARLMLGTGGRGGLRGKPHRTKIPRRQAPGPLDRVNRQVRARASNMLWVSDCRAEIGERVQAVLERRHEGAWPFLRRAA